MAFEPERLAPFVMDSLKLPVLSREEQIKLVQRAQTSKKKKVRDAARDKLVRHNMRLILKFAKKWSRTNTSTDAVVAAAMDGMNRAIDKFNPNKGTAFTTYARPWIEVSIRTFIYDDHSAIRAAKTNNNVQLFFGNRDRHNLNDPGTRGDLARWAQSPYSLDSPVSGEYSDEELTFKDLLVESSGTSEDLLLQEESKTEAKRLIDQALDQLDERERYIVRTRHLSDEDKAPTLQKISEHFGFSRERARQIEMKALRKMTQYLQSQGSLSGSNVI